MSYTPPVAEQVFALQVNAGIAELAASERFAAADADMVTAIVEGIGAFAAGEFAPLARVGDIEGARLADGAVTLPDGYAAAYRAYVEQGWNAVAGAEEHGGQGLPFSLAVCVLENLGAANMAFSLLPMLTVGAIEAIERHAARRRRRSICPG